MFAFNIEHTHCEHNLDHPGLKEEFRFDDALHYGDTRTRIVCWCMASVCVGVQTAFSFIQKMHVFYFGSIDTINSTIHLIQTVQMTQSMLRFCAYICVVQYTLRLQL